MSQPKNVQLSKYVHATLATKIEAANSRGSGFVLVKEAQELHRSFMALETEKQPKSPVSGAFISIKDNFDQIGDVTLAGSRVLANCPPAKQNARAVERLIRAGAVVLGRTHMSEFAYSGLGLNPHYRVLENPIVAGSIPGGSSSGAAVSVAKGIVTAALGTDTGGSLRIPAAYCGIVGFKPKQSSSLLDGVVPLSPTLDSVGVIARNVETCAAFFQVLGDTPFAAKTETFIFPCTLVVPSGLLFEGLDHAVADAFERAVYDLEKFGFIIKDQQAPEIDEIMTQGVARTIVGYEAFHWQQSQGYLVNPEKYDPAILKRIVAGSTICEADYHHQLTCRENLIQRARLRAANCDAYIYPTAPTRPPTFEACAGDGFDAANAKALRNTSPMNVLDWPCLSLPLPGSVGIGLSVARPDNDSLLLQLALQIQRALQ